MLQLRVQRLPMLSPPAPPSGSVLDHIAECLDKSYACYGKYNGDNTQKQFLNQMMVNDGLYVTGFGLILGRHGAPADPLIIGLNSTNQIPDPMQPDTWTHGYGIINAADLPTADEFYWVTGVFDTPIHTTDFSLEILAVTNADCTTSSYWAWAACNGILPGLSYGYVWTYDSQTWVALPDTLSYLCWTQGGDTTGACCVGTTCSQTTQANCSGTFKGVGIPCSPNPCASTMGACCVGTTCSQTTQAGCTGTFKGVGVSCSPNPCGGGTGCTNPTGIEGDTNCRGEDEYTCTDGQWVLTDANSPNCETCKCSTYTQESICTNAKDIQGRTCCWWYAKYPWEEPKCTDREPTLENRIMDYLPFIIAGVGGVALIAILLARRGQSYPYPPPSYYPPPQPYYPPPQPYYPPQGGR